MQVPAPATQTQPPPPSANGEENRSAQTLGSKASELMETGEQNNKKRLVFVGFSFSASSSSQTPVLSLIQPDGADPWTT